MSSNLDLYENKAAEPDVYIHEIISVAPDMILLEEASPFAENSVMTRLLAAFPQTPILVISEDSNLLYIVHCEARLLGSSTDLIEAIQSELDRSPS